MSVPVCSGGTINGGVTSITFTNNNPNTCYTITSCKSQNGQTMPGWPATPPVIPEAQNGVDGNYVVQLAVAAVSGNTYTYTTDPICPALTNPKIRVQ
jgi:hypothetical protein